MNEGIATRREQVAAAQWFSASSADRVSARKEQPQNGNALLGCGALHGAVRVRDGAGDA
jgi:hypothetical protein